MIDQELKDLEKNKARLELDIKKLAHEKSVVLKEIKDCQLVIEKYRVNESEVRAKFDEVVNKVDSAENRLREIEGKIAQDVSDFEEKVNKAQMVITQATKDRLEIEAEKVHLKKKTSEFNERLQKESSEKFDYEQAMSVLNKRILDVEKRELEASAREIRFAKDEANLQASILANKELEQKFNDSLKELELTKSNYTDQRNQLNQEWEAIEKAKKELRK